MKTFLATLCLAAIALIPARADEISNLAADCTAAARDSLFQTQATDFVETTGATQSVVDFVTQKADDAPSMLALFEEALEAQKAAGQQEIQILNNAAKIQAKLELALEKSLVEREEERLDAGSALPEDGPTPVPFSLSRPESVVSAGNASFDRMAGSNPCLVATPEPSTWALFGCGAFLLICTLPKRLAKPGIKTN
jgi:hypothetical protein